MRVVLLALIAGLVFCLVLPFARMLVGIDGAGGFTGDVAFPMLRRLVSFVLALACTGVLVQRVWRLMVR